MFEEFESIANAVIKTRRTIKSTGED